MGLNPLGRNWGSVVNWDTLGKAYAGFIVAWTLILVFGVVWLIFNRRVPFIRMRNLPLAFASTAFLHVYLVKILLAYTTNGHFLCSAEFWIMSIYLPLGMALFQASNTQLLYIVKIQRKYTAVSTDDKKLLASSRPQGWAQWLRRDRAHNRVTGTMTCIAYAMGVQVNLDRILAAVFQSLT